VILVLNNIFFDQAAYIFILTTYLKGFGLINIFANFKMPMLRISVIIILICVFNAQLTALEFNNPPKKKTKREFIKTNYQVGAGMMGSVLYLSRNIKEDNDAKGYVITANYGGQNYCRINVQYTQYKPINIEPTWYDIKANTIEANLEILARFKNEVTLLYPFVGFSYNTFKGYFTGLDDYLNLQERYKRNSTVKSTWLGLNIGTGIEHAFGPVVLFFDYRMRLGKTDSFSNINVQDVCYGGGLRLKIYVPKSNHTRKKTFGSGNRYKLI